MNLVHTRGFAFSWCRRHASTSSTTISRSPIAINNADFPKHKHAKIEPSILDTPRLRGNNVSFTKRSKINQALYREERVISLRDKGMISATGDDVADVINEALSTAKLAGTFRRVKDPSEFVKIAKVVMNRDYSHADAFWVCPIVQKFVSSCPETFSIERKNQIAAKMEAYITKSLQKREPQLRSQLTMKMAFKKTPRIFFRPLKKPNSFGVLSGDQDDVLVDDDDDDNDYDENSKDEEKKSKEECYEFDTDKDEFQNRS